MCATESCRRSRPDIGVGIMNDLAALEAILFVTESPIPVGELG